MVQSGTMVPKNKGGCLQEVGLFQAPLAACLGLHIRWGLEAVSLTYFGLLGFGFTL